MSFRLILLIFCQSWVLQIIAQSNPDTSVQTLPVIGVSASSNSSEVLHGFFQLEGKKHEEILMSNRNHPVAEKQARQIFAQVPGVFVYDMDGTGNQLNIAVRGLDPHRGWEFNFRKDGIITNTDLYGYPASHYNLPIEAVEKIELVRGTGSLQYGAHFGGMLNFVTKAPSQKPIDVEALSVVGSFNLISNFIRVSGTKGNWSYSGWLNRKSSDGYRDNAESKYGAECLTLMWRSDNDRLSVKLEWTHSEYLTQLPGPLTDSMFLVNPRMSTRGRNYYSPSIHVPSLMVKAKLNKRAELIFNQIWLTGSRNSVMFDKPANVADLRDSLTGDFARRQVDIDIYSSLTSEIRVKHSLSEKRKFYFTYGTQLFLNNLYRRQQGKGTTGSDYDLTIGEEGWGRRLNYRTRSGAIFMESFYYLTHNFVLNFGARGEYGTSRMEGYMSYYPEDILPISIKHRFPLLGTGFQFDWKMKSFLYGGISQGYRPVLLKDIIPASIYERTDPNFSNAQGYNAELGFKTKAIKDLFAEFTAFYLNYQNRPGVIVMPDSTYGEIYFRTNLGNSHTYGIECLVRYQKNITSNLKLEVFSSSAWMRGVYNKGTLISGNENFDISGNKLENVPALISRNGITINWTQFNFSAQYSYTAKTFSDAYNDVAPSASGAKGLVPEYHIFDLNAGIKLTKYATVRLNIGNITNESYFTKRPQFYPGPGIWPSDGRTFSVTVIVNA